eukprot:m.100622 g.100622  ORF g.100622 m.100622 type:complete len:207 (+) comp15135_c0_seq2:132-752(+)
MLKLQRQVLPTLQQVVAPRHLAAQHIQSRTIFQMWNGWMRAVWNRVDSSRLEMVGKDRLAAEWLLKLGGAVEMNLPPSGSKWYRNYNGLPWLGETNRGGKPNKEAQLLKVEAKGIEITDSGLTHLQGLSFVNEVTLNDTEFITNAAVETLASLHACNKIDLRGTSLNDLEALLKLPALSELVVDPNAVSEALQEQFKARGVAVITR